jgi:hypothetical protein
MEDEGKDQEQREEQVQSEKPEEVDADQIFSEAIGEAPEVDGKDQGTPEEKPAVAPEEKPAEGKDEATPRDEDPETLKKRLADTQKWGHELSGEVAALKKKIEEIEATSKAAEKAKADEVPENVKSFYEDFPGFSDAVQYEAQKLLRNTLGDVDVKSLHESVRQQEGQRAFERQVVGGFYDSSGQFVEGHPDAYRVMASPEFKSWADEREKAMPGFLGESDPSKAIQIISQFKEHSAKQAAAKHDAALAAKASQVKEFASGGVPQGNKGATGKTKADDDDPESIFNKAAGIK